MSLSVDQLFIDMFESEVHHAYGREGAKLENLVRHGGSGQGRRVWFPKIGKKRTQSKARHAEVQIQDRNETGVWCNIIDDYTQADMIDELDEMKTNVALRQTYTRDHAWALGRESDQKIITAMAGTSNTTATAGVVSLAKINEIFTYFGNNAIPHDTNRYLAVSAKGWTDLMAIPQFASADFVPEAEMPFKGAAGTAKRWFSFLCFVQEGGVDDDGNPDAGALPKAGNIRSSIAWHNRGIGYHKQAGPSTKIDWENLRQAWSIVSKQACGAVLIDGTAVYLCKHDETAIPA
jgi:hypothetical protein